MNAVLSNVFDLEMSAAPAGNPPPLTNDEMLE
jgi:hypothetical protein